MSSVKARSWGVDSFLRATIGCTGPGVLRQLGVLVGRHTALMDGWKDGSGQEWKPAGAKSGVLVYLDLRSMHAND